MILCLQHLSSNSEMPFNKVRSIICALKEHDIYFICPFLSYFLQSILEPPFLLPHLERGGVCGGGGGAGGYLTYFHEAERLGTLIVLFCA